MLRALDRTSSLLICCIATALIFLAATASAGFYNIDEALYFAVAQTWYETGSFVVQNGFDEFVSDDLKLWLLVEGPRGLVSQYPVGTAVAGAPLIGFFGQSSLIVLNVLAGIGTLFTTYAVALRLFGSTDVAKLAVALLALCTFWAEFVVGHWPHSVSVFLISLALLLFLGTLDRTKRAWHPALWSGVLVGLGMFFRLEGLLLLPAIAAVTILYARRPIQVITGGALGLGPMIGLMALSNNARFGSLNPFSYGASGHGTDALTYVTPGIIMIVLLVGLIAVRYMGELGPRFRTGIAVLVLIGLAAMLLSPLAPSLNKVVDGMHAILVDATVIEDKRPGALVRFPDGTVSFWGFPKKALGQSLPWLGCLAALFGLTWGDRRRGITIVLIICAAWSVPFVLLSWHGGLGANMRYFLPMLPLLAALVAWVILELGKRTAGQGARIVLIAAMAGLALPTLLALSAPEIVFRLHQILSTNLLFIIAALTLIANLALTRLTTLAALSAIGAGMGFSSFLAVQDYTTSQAYRARVAAYADAVSGISGRVLFYGPPENFFPALFKPEQLLALPDSKTSEFDYDLFDAACAAGYRVIITKRIARTLAPTEPKLTDYVWSFDGRTLRLSEYRCGS